MERRDRCMPEKVGEVEEPGGAIRRDPLQAKQQLARGPPQAVLLSVNARPIRGDHRLRKRFQTLDRLIIGDDEVVIVCEAVLERVDVHERR